MKRITAKIDEYEKDGETKGKYIDIGVVGTSQHGEYIILNPEVNLAGVALRQRMLAANKGEKPKGTGVMCSVWDNEPRQQAPDDYGPPPQEDFDDDIPF